MSGARIKKAANSALRGRNYLVIARGREMRANSMSELGLAPDQDEVGPTAQLSCACRGHRARAINQLDIQSFEKMFQCRSTRRVAAHDDNAMDSPFTRREEPQCCRAMIRTLATLAALVSDDQHLCVRARTSDGTHARGAAEGEVPRQELPDTRKLFDADGALAGSGQFCRLEGSQRSVALGGLDKSQLS
jgi:hypothetical protein